MQTWTVVRHAHTDKAIAFIHRVDRNLGTFRRVIDSVVDQVYHHLQDKAYVHLCHKQRVIAVHLHVVVCNSTVGMAQRFFNNFADHFGLNLQI